MDSTISDIIDYIKYYQMYLGQAIAYGYVNEKIYDFYSNNQESYRSYCSSLGLISKSLCKSQHLLFGVLLVEDKDSKNIYRLINMLLSTNICDDSKITDKIKIIANEMQESIKSYSLDIFYLKEYRNKVYAHLAKGIFSTEWQIEFKRKNPCDFGKLSILCTKLFDGIATIITLLGGDPFEKTFIQPLDIDYLLLRLK